MGHGHHTYEVPDASVYKVEDVPQLKKVQEKLAAKGLKDPWLRNEVWRYTVYPGVFWPTVRNLTRGLIVGIPAFLITIGIEQAYGITYGPKHDDHGSHDDHH